MWWCSLRKGVSLAERISPRARGQGELIPRQLLPIGTAGLAVKLAGTSVKEDVGRMLTWLQVIYKQLWPTQQSHLGRAGGGGLGQNATSFDSCLLHALILMERERHLVGGCLVAWLTAGGTLLLSKSYSCIVVMSRENTPRCKSRTPAAVEESSKWGDEL